MCQYIQLCEPYLKSYTFTIAHEHGWLLSKLLVDVYQYFVKSQHCVSIKINALTYECMIIKKLHNKAKNSKDTM